jgi:hypothetical protein
MTTQNAGHASGRASVPESRAPPGPGAPSSDGGRAPDASGRWPGMGGRAVSRAPGSQAEAEARAQSLELRRQCLNALGLEISDRVLRVSPEDLKRLGNYGAGR